MMEFDDLAGDASGDRTTMWLKGIGLPVLLVLLGFWLSGQEEFSIPGGSEEWVVSGRAAHWALGALASVALFLHFHYFWGLRDAMMVSRAGKGGCALAFMVCVLMMVVHSMGA